MKHTLRRLMAMLMIVMLLSTDLVVLAEAAAPEVSVPEVSEPMTALVLPASLDVIEEEAFMGATSIGYVIVPEGTSAIKARAFANSSLTGIDLPVSITSIADDAFSGCGDFTVNAPEGSFAYNWCVEKGYIEGEAPVEGDFVIEEIEDGGYAINGYNGTDTVVTIPAEIDGKRIVAIGYKTFANSNIEKVVISEGIRDIFSRTFENCDSLTEIQFPSTLEYISYKAFADCDSLTSVVFPEGMRTVGEESFRGCDKLASVVLPSSIEYIEYAVFENCESLTGVTFASGIDEFEIFGRAFANTAITGIELPEGLNYIDSNVFEDCKYLTRVKLPASLVEDIYNNFFQG